MRPKLHDLSPQKNVPSSHGNHPCVTIGTGAQKQPSLRRSMPGQPLFLKEADKSTAVVWNGRQPSISQVMHQPLIPPGKKPNLLTVQIEF